MEIAEKMMREENFSYDGYQVVRGEFFAHTFEPSITFNDSKVYVNTACLNRMPTVEYIQILINQQTKKLVVRPCREDEKTLSGGAAIRPNVDRNKSHAGYFMQN